MNDNLNVAPGSGLQNATTPILDMVRASLDDDKAIEPVVIDLAGKTQIADWMVVATGTSQRHLASMADHVVAKLKAAGNPSMGVEGADDPQASWVVIDAGDVIVHLFRAETRVLYDIEKLWSLPLPGRGKQEPTEGLVKPKPVRKQVAGPRKVPKSA